MSAFYDLASLVLVPSGYKASKVYAQKPLTTDGQLTFSRASTATRVNSAGLIETVSSNVPRLDYLNSSCPRLLLEPQRTNSAEYSEQLDNAWWIKNNQSVTANNTTAPDGFSNADLLIPAAGTADHYILSGTVSGTTSQVVTLSIFVKKKDHDYFYFGTGGASAFGAVVYRFSTNTFTLSGLSATATNYGNGWIRLTITGTTGATDLRMLFTPTDATGSRTFNANGTDGTWVWGMQAETAASYATSYIPTTGAAVTRLADACSKTGISSLIGQTEGTLFFEIKDTENFLAYLGVDNLSTGTRILIYGAGDQKVYTQIRNSSTVVFGAESAAISGAAKAAVSFNSSGSVFYVNGVQVATGSGTTYTNLSQLTFNQASQIGSIVNQALLFKTRLTNAQLAELTTL